MSSGELNISGGFFSENEASSRGGVIVVEDGTFHLEGGIFENNKAVEGGVGFIKLDGTRALVTGGNYSGNEADNGGVFYVDEHTIFTVSLEGCPEMTRQLVCPPFDTEPFSICPSIPRRKGDIREWTSQEKGSWNGRPLSHLR